MAYELQTSSVLNYMSNIRKNGPDVRIGKTEGLQRNEIVDWPAIVAPRTEWG